MTKQQQLKTDQNFAAFTLLNECGYQIAALYEGKRDYISIAKELAWFTTIDIMIQSRALKN